LNPIALFGGTFDPVHFGHLGLARAAFAQLEPGSLRILPAGNPYQKGRAPFASAEHRLEMLRLAFKDDADIAIDDRELRREGPTYTYDTLRELRRSFGRDASLVWLIGGDAFARLDTWHRWDELFGLTHFAIIDRPTHRLEIADSSAALRGEMNTRLAGLLETHRSPAGAVVVLGMTPPPVSSTDIRAAIARGESVRGLTPDAVCDYIEQHQLYHP
jgi:nicotinate-nucleotide adenylyltransferase